MSLWDTIRGAFDKDRQYFTYYRVPPQQVLDRRFEQRPVRAGLHYVRIWLSEMFLRKDVAYAQGIYPAVQSVVQMSFGGAQPVEIPTIADLSRLGSQTAGPGGDIIARNFPLTPTMPFVGGVVSLSAGMIALSGPNHIAAFIKALGGFASLLAVPQLSTSLSLVAPLASGIQDLVGVGNGRLHLGLIETFTAETLQEGYIVVIRAPVAQIDARTLWVERDIVWYGESPGARTPLSTADHMLFRVEIFTERDDWDSLTAIAAPYQEALSALAAQDERRATEALRAAILAAFRAPELTQAHRRVVIEELKRRYAGAAHQLLAGPVAFSGGDEEGPGAASLGAALHGAKSAEDAFAEGPIDLAEALRGIPA